MESLRIESKTEVCEPLTHARSPADRSCCLLEVSNTSTLECPHLRECSDFALPCFSEKQKQQKPNVDIKEGMPRPFILGLSESVK